jgi:hypothetical protein
LTSGVKEARSPRNDGRTGIPANSGDTILVLTT